MKPIEQKHKIFNFISTSNENKLQKNMCLQLKEYLITNYKLKFETERKNILKIELDKLQPYQELDFDYTKLIYQSKNDYKKFLKFNENNQKLLKNLIDAGNNVLYLDIIETLEKYNDNRSMKVSENQMILSLSQCVFIHNKMSIFKIYTESEFQILFEDILPFYKAIDKNKNNIAIRYVCVSKIIDILFVKAINLE
jgi:hypothetical protein